MKSRASKNAVWAIGAGVALFIGFCLCRYLFFGLHGMKEWPLNLFIFGLIAIIVAAFFSARKVMTCIPLGYIGGFIIGMLTLAEGVDPGGGKTSNAWIIWTVFFLSLSL